MILYFAVAIITIVIALWVKTGYAEIPYGYTKQQVLNRLCLISVFLLLFSVSALRLNVGNDYAKYVEYFHLIRCKLDTEVVVPTEFGFNAVCLALYFLSGRNENYLLMFAVFAFATIYFFLKGIYKQSESFFLSFFLFMTLGYYFQTFSTIRYYFALALAFVSIPYVLNKQYIKFVIIVLLGATIHKSLLIVLPMYLLACGKWKKYHVILLGLICSTTLIFKDFYMGLFLKIYPTYENTQYLDGGTSLINIARCAAVLIWSFIEFKDVVKDNRRNLFYFYCNIGALYVYAFFTFLPSVSRMGYYLSITHILFIPVLIKGIANEKLRKAVTALVMIACIGYFIVFMIYKAPMDGLRILPYQTFLYHDMVPILSDVS